METQMSRIHQTTYNALFGYPIAHNLQWHDLRSLLNSLADMTEDRNGNLKFTRNGETVIVHPPRHKDLSDIQELMKIRHFLERSSVPAQPIIAEGVHLLAGRYRSS